MKAKKLTGAQQAPLRLIASEEIALRDNPWAQRRWAWPFAGQQEIERKLIARGYAWYGRARIPGRAHTRIGTWLTAKGYSALGLAGCPLEPGRKMSMKDKAAL